ncbi:LuxR C-terminal-related transcriptional regulator [Actinomadura sp. 9N407]|uniref:helix-turn-helix transcriptional regulator n=1 Tax=Actinomadura sp. 9N407 TaxID=3375154 RepID=UPI00378C95D7
MNTNFAAALTSFVGRDRELVQLHARIAEHRLVTLTGEGGSGKSRLAAHLCGELEETVEETWWVDLGPVVDPGLVVRTVADTLGVRSEPEADPTSGLLRRLHAPTTVLCLDTCEHLLDAVADLIRRLLLGCERLVVLATSREALGVPGEAVYRVPSLTPADAQRLFSERAALSDPHFTMDDSPAEVAAICARLDGLPLAIELAAAWVHALTPAQIAAGLADSLQLLGGGPRTVIPRHRTLMASMDWSHDLLDPHEQRVLRRLAVFGSDFTAAAAAAVAGERWDDDERAGHPAENEHALVVTRRLVDKSLVATRRHQDQVRYRLLDTVRHYAFDKLRRCGEVARARDRHLAYYLDLAVEAADGATRDQDHWRAVLEAERDNIHAGLQWALTPARAESSRLLAATMSHQWMIRSQAHEGLGFLQRALGLAPDARSAVQARLHVGRAWLAMVAGHVHQAGESAAVAGEIATEIDDTAIGAQATAMRAYSLYFVDPPRCHELADQARAMSESAGDAFTQDWATVLDAYTLNRRDRHAEAAAIARPAYERALARHDRFCGSFALGIDMLARLHTGEVRRSVSVGVEVMALAEPLGDYFAYGSNATNVAHAFGMAGDIDRGMAIMARIVQGMDRSSDVDVIAYVYVIGLLHLWSGRPTTALEWFERGMQQHDTYEWTALRCLAPQAAALRRLGRTEEAGHAAARAVTAAIEIDSPYLLASARDEQARLIATADPARAFDLHHQALALRREHHLTTYLPDSLDALGGLAATTGSPGAAARMLAAGRAAREQMGCPRPPVARPDHERTIALVRRELGEKAYREHSEEGAALALDAVIADATRGRGPRNRPTVGWSSLSPTELAVALMVADGLPNPEIAARMFISRSTVKTHLSHIYAKLGTSSRTELAAIAAAARSAGERRR